MDVKRAVRPKTALAPTSATKAPSVDSLVPKSADPLSRLASTMGGPTSMTDDPLLAFARDRLIGEEGAEQSEAQGPPTQGGGTDPLKWVLGHQAPSTTQLRDYSDGMIKNALDKYDSAPRTKESKAFLDTARELNNELGQLGALVSLAKASGNWNQVGVQAAGAIMELLAQLAEMAPGMLERGDDLKGQSIDYRDRVRAGRFNFYSRATPFHQKSAGQDTYTPPVMRQFKTQ